MISLRIFMPFYCTECGCMIFHGLYRFLKSISLLIQCWNVSHNNSKVSKAVHENYSELDLEDDSNI